MHNLDGGGHLSEKSIGRYAANTVKMRKNGGRFSAIPTNLVPPAGRSPPFHKNVTCPQKYEENFFALRAILLPLTILLLSTLRQCIGGHYTGQKLSE